MNFRLMLGKVYIHSNDASAPEEAEYYTEQSYVWLLRILGYTGLGWLVWSWTSERWRFKIWYRPCTFSEATVVRVDGKEVVDFLSVRRTGDRWGHSGQGYVQDQVSWCFIHLHRGYILNHINGVFERLDFDLPHSEVCAQEGLTDSQVSDRRKVYGEAYVSIPTRSVAALLIEEVFHPFLVFQILSMWIWYLDEYVIYAVCIAVVTVTSIILEVYNTRSNAKDIAELAEQDSSAVVRVFRNGVWVELSSREVVCGDLIEVASDWKVPAFDFMLTTGTAIVDEALLTGEAVPVSKSALQQSKADTDGFTVFAGTKVLQTRGRVLGVVMRTGFSTTQGNLMRMLLLPQETRFTFYEDSLRFVGVLVIVATIGTCYTVWLSISFGWDVWETLLRSVDTLSCTVPPALPAAMSLGVVSSMDRIKRKRIRCIRPNSINAAGQIKTMVFDKTGTLTLEDVDIVGFVPAVNQTLVPTSDAQSLPKHYFHTMAACHTIASVHGNLRGDPIDLKMFGLTGWELKDEQMVSDQQPQDGSVLVTVRPPGHDVAKYIEDFRKQSSGIRTAPVNGSDQPTDTDGESSDGLGEVELPLELGIIRNFEFSSALQRQSVIARRPGSSNAFAFVKGSCEKVSELCLPETLPPNLTKVLADYSSQGVRVLALAYKEIHGLHNPQAMRLSRHAVESNLHFAGLILLENKLKPDTPEAMQLLTDAKVRCIMATGDNALTALSVARDCNMAGDKVVLGDMSKNGYEVEWSLIDDGFASTDFDQVCKHAGIRPNHASIMVTGAAFRRLRESCPCTEALVNKPLISSDNKCFERLLMQGVVYARMSPDDKAALVSALQDLPHKPLVGMAGDGANDIAALKIADVGISLSDAEASVAAPFSSMDKSIRSVVDVLLEGRESLLNSYAAFKFVSLTAMVQFCTLTILYTIRSNFTDTQYVYLDCFTIMPLSIFMFWTETPTKLSTRLPTDSLIGGPMIASLVGQIAIQMLFQAGLSATLYSFPDYVAMEESDEVPKNEDLVCHLNTALFIFALVQQTCLSVVFGLTPPYWRNMKTNLIFYLYIVLLSAGIGVMLVNVMPLESTPLNIFVDAQQWLMETLLLMKLTVEANMALWAFMAMNIAVSFLYEWVIIRPWDNRLADRRLA